MIKHALKALASSLSGCYCYYNCYNNIINIIIVVVMLFLGDIELDNKSASIAIVGIDRPFEIIENEGYYCCYCYGYCTLFSFIIILIYFLVLYYCIYITKL